MTALSAGLPRVARMYHPSLHVPDLGEAEDFFARVFGRPSVRLSTMFDRTVSRGGLPDHSTFTLIGDVLVDSIDPRRYLVGGRQCYPDVVRPRLRGIGWYVEGVEALYRKLLAMGVDLVDQLDVAVGGDDPPTAVGSAMPLFFTLASDAGLRHELVPRFAFPLDPRCEPGWTLPPPSPDDPLGIVRCANHTVVTADPQRAKRLLVDAFGGTVVHQGRDDLPAASVTSIAVADAVVRLVVPDPPAHVSAAEDEYSSIAWLVVDLDRVEAHLHSQGVGIAVRTATSIVADPDTSLGIPWEFTAAAPHS